ncbi:MAG: HD domain-containing phosphohydrolase [Candidatus Omnitrophota bacterium]
MERRKGSFSLDIFTADHIGVGLFKYRLVPKKKFVSINGAFARMMGYKRKKDIIDKDFSLFFASPHDATVFFNSLKRRNKVRFFETRFNKNGRSKVWVAITAVTIKSKTSEYIEGIIEDITAHHHMEEKLALERDYMRNILDNIPDAIYFKDKNNRIIKVNKFYAQGAGFSPTAIIGKTDFDFFPQEQARKMWEDDNYVLTTGKPIIGKVERTLLPNGHWNQVITTKIAMYDGGGKIIGTMGITRDMTAYANLEHDRLAMVMNGLNVLVRALELRDPYTFSHTRLVADIAESIAKEMQWDENRILGLRLAAELHDLGKISIPMDILNKPGRLSELEYGLIKEHVNRCYELIKEISFPFPLAETIGQHHERIDGTGYPYQLKGDDILIEARILAVGDVLEAMTHRRPYREALGLITAKEELKKGAGVRYDAGVVGIVFNLFNKNNNRPFWNLA